MVLYIKVRKKTCRQNDGFALTPCTPQSWNILLKIGSAYFNFAHLRNLCCLYKTIEDDYLSNLVQKNYSVTANLMDQFLDF